MKKVFRILGIVIIIVVVVIMGGYFYINSSDIPSYPVEEVSYKADVTPVAIERGEKLARMLCANCHMNPKTNKLGGTTMLDAPPEFGIIKSANITQDKTYGIGNWTDGELVYLFRTGIKKDGQYAPPYMPKFPHMADEDINAIIAFLRSEHELVAADPTPDPPSQPAFLTKALSSFVWKPFPMPENKIPMPDTTNQLEFGKYLAINLECFSCHSADFKTNDFMTPENSKGYFGGGNKPLDRKGRVKLTSNLTPDKETGIGNWSEDKFIQAVKYGYKEGEPGLSFPMLPYAYLTNKEVKAIYAYLQSLPPINNKVERSIYE